MTSENPNLSFSIGQVAQHTGLPQSVLRYWETVFDLLKPKKSPGGTRLYSQDDIRLILRIKNLLYENGFTIKGANTQLKKETRLSVPSETVPNSSDFSTSDTLVTKQKNKKPNEAVISVGELQQVVVKLKELMDVLK